jgi:chorismate mutase
MGSAGLEWLSNVKRETGLKTATEVANSKHVEEALKSGVDILWIGARTTTNPFAVQEVAEAAGGSGVPVLVKNPVNPDLELWIGAVERLISCGTDNIAFVHRGFGAYEKGLFRNQPQWHIPIELKRRIPSATILCDPSHIGGRRDLIYPISQQAMDLGFDGLMVETHINPSVALSDKEQQITPALLEKITKLLVIRNRTEPSEYLADLRREIDELDDRLLNVLSKRMSISREIGKYKMDNNMQVLQPLRYDKMVTSRIAQALGLELDEEFVKQILESIHEESVRQQFEIINKMSLSQKFD